MFVNGALADGPQRLPVQHTEGLILGRSGPVSIQFRANPEPNVQWYVDGVSIPQGVQNGRYEASMPENMGAGEWKATLVIDSVTLEDTTKEYYLKASNEFGHMEYTAVINSSQNDNSKPLLDKLLFALDHITYISTDDVLSFTFSRRSGHWMDRADRDHCPDCGLERRAAGSRPEDWPLVFRRSV